MPENGNFVLSEFTVGIDAIPEPSILSLVAAATLLVIATKRRGQKSRFLPTPIAKSNFGLRGKVR
jgi:hypothetical protein